MIISFNGVSCGYKNHCVVSNLSFSFRTGEATCILGSNGIGKTTIFKSLLGYLPLMEGTIYVDNTDLKTMTVKQRASIMAYVPQAKSYSYQFTVRDIVLMGRASYIPRFQTPGNEEYSVVNQTLEKVGISEYSNRYYSELSGGEQQMVLLARAIAQGSKYILLDEPASNLDYLNQKKLLNLIIDLTDSGIGILMVSHSPEHAFMCCKNTLMIDTKGHYVYGQTQDVITSDNLKRTYGVSIGIAQVEDIRGKKINACYLE